MSTLKRLRLEQQGSSGSWVQAASDEKAFVIFLGDRIVGECVLDPEGWEEFQKIAAVREVAVSYLEAQEMRRAAALRDE